MLCAPFKKRLFIIIKLEIEFFPIWFLKNAFLQKKTYCLDLTFSFCLLSTTGDQVAVREGEVLQLFCESDSLYHLCYWEHGDKRFYTKTEDKEVFTELFSWSRSDTLCGIVIDNADTVHQGKIL